MFGFSMQGCARLHSVNQQHEEGGEHVLVSRCVEESERVADDLGEQYLRGNRWKFGKLCWIVGFIVMTATHHNVMMAILTLE